MAGRKAQAPSAARWPTPSPPPYGGTGGDDFYDVSLVDGFNVPTLVAPQAPSPSPAANGSYQATGCAADLNGACPAELRVASPVAGVALVACRSACRAFGAAQYCCSGAYGSPAACAPTAYSRFFKTACPHAYSYAYDDAASTFTCAATGGGHDVVFCPGTSRYARRVARSHVRTSQSSICRRHPEAVVGAPLGQPPPPSSAPQPSTASHSAIRCRCPALSREAPRPL
ncbi:hypothetical protein ACP70R_036736 [Stipagrostis hirtigluma subsp. patula]